MFPFEMVPFSDEMLIRGGGHGVEPTPPKTNMTMEKQPFEDVFPIK